jgi:hypothetical protein
MTDAEERIFDKGTCIAVGVSAGLVILIFVVAFVMTDSRAEVNRQIALENAAIESAPAVPGMILVHQINGKAMRINVDEIESYQIAKWGEGSLILFKARQWAILEPAQGSLVVQESLHILD